MGRLLDGVRYRMVAIRLYDEVPSSAGIKKDTHNVRGKLLPLEWERDCCAGIKNNTRNIWGLLDRSSLRVLRAMPANLLAKFLS